MVLTAGAGRVLGCAVALALAAWTVVPADQVVLDAAADTMIQPLDVAKSNGQGRHLCVGMTGQPALRRAMIRFDFSTVPSNSIIDSVTLDLYLSKAAPAGGGTFELRPITTDWGEGASGTNVNGCNGSTALLNDATWKWTFYDPGDPPGSPEWATTGGDFGTASASLAVSGTLGHKRWTSAQLTTDVQGWLDNPATNFGWLIQRSDETASQTAVRFESRNGEFASQRPKLTVSYSAGAPTGGCCFAGQACVELSAVDCGSQGGTFRGDGSSCTPNPCPPDATGACCAVVGSCTSVAEASCTSSGGTYQGDAVTCAAADCSVTLEPFVDALPVPAVAQPISGNPGGLATYEIVIQEVQQQLHRDLPPTTVWGYGDDPSNAASATFPGPTIETTSDQQVTVHWINDLRDTSAPGDPKPLRTDHYLEVAGTAAPPACQIHGAEDLAKAVVHVHGAHVPAEFDGYPEFTYLPGNEDLYVYPNHQQSGTIWYHDHALGITRLNVYMGLAGFWLIRDAFENALGLPSGEYEVPLAIQDRSFNGDGSLDYPSMWMQHYFGDKTLVNGKVWPYFDVKQGKYRFRVLNGSGSRTYTLYLDRSDIAGDHDMTFHQFGTDGGLMELPVASTEITLAPAERADLVLDFESIPVGSEITLLNSAPAPFPGSPGNGVVPDVMKFVVQDQAGFTGPLPASLRPLEVLEETSSIKTRDFTLDTEADACGLTWKINGLGWDDITEYPTLGTTEIWRFINPRNIMHPMHMHLVFFQVLDRTPIGGGTPIPPDPSEVGWKDTVRADPQMITRVIARFEDYTGKYAYHCHILEHEDHEMMRQFETVESIGMALDGDDILWPAQPRRHRLRHRARRLDRASRHRRKLRPGQRDRELPGRQPPDHDDQRQRPAFRGRGLLVPDPRRRRWRQRHLRQRIVPANGFPRRRDRQLGQRLPVGPRRSEKPSGGRRPERIRTRRTSVSRPEVQRRVPDPGPLPGRDR